MNGGDRVSILFAGTSLITATQTNAAAEPKGKGVPPTPDGGCLCFVLRSGFSSAQGELMQMIEFSQQKVRGGGTVCSVCSGCSWSGSHAT